MARGCDDEGVDGGMKDDAEKFGTVLTTISRGMGTVGVAGIGLIKELSVECYVRPEMDEGGHVVLATEHCQSRVLLSHHPHLRIR